MPGYRDDTQALEARVDALERELMALREQSARARLELDLESEREAELAERLEAREAPPAGRTRFDRVLQTIVYVPLGAMLGGTVVVAVALLVIGIPVMVVTDDPGAWFSYLLGLLLIAGIVGGAWSSAKSIWSSS
jgi:hypothetical protein